MKVSKRIGMLLLPIIAVCGGAGVFLATRARTSEPVVIHFQGWNGTLSGGTNVAGMLVVTNQCAHGVAVGLRAQTLNVRGSWEPLPETLVFDKHTANIMVVVPPHSSTNITLRWAPERSGKWRVDAFFQRVLSAGEGRVLKFLGRLRMVYPLWREGTIRAIEIDPPGAPQK